MRLDPDNPSKRACAKFALVALAAGLWLTGCGAGRPAPAPAPLTAVDGQRALELTARLVASGPRPAGSANAAATVALLADLCRQTGLECTVDVWEEEAAGTPKIFRNLRVVKPGRAPGRVIVGSHLDTKVLPQAPGFVGANDSASSSALLVELIRVLAPCTPWPGRTLEFVFFDGEECVVSYGPADGFHGSRRLARELREAGRVAECRAMVLLDMIGDRDLTVTLPCDADPDLCRRVFAIAEAQGVRDRFGYFLNGTIADDHTPFQQSGIPAIDLIDFQYGPGNAFWHTEQDTLDKLSAESLATVGRVALQLVWDVAQAR